MDYLLGLNKQQKEAVEHTEGPLLVLAGAGAGKTRVITHRIIHLIRSGIAPENILAVTFTNKAAGEMKERMKKLMEEDRPQQKTSPFVATFHSLGVYILRHHADKIGLNRHFTIYDRNDSVKAVKEGIINSGYDPKQYEPRKVLSAISKNKGDGVSLEDYSPGNNFFKKLIAEVWKKYEETLFKEKALDFDDLLLKTYKLLNENEEIKKNYNRIWKYVHIDEYQDTNNVQYGIARMLSENNNICVVGDIDQNIYSWRGADIENILAFEKHFPGTKTILLEQNYRSTKTIIQVSNDIIKKNTNRKEKNLFTENHDGELLHLYGAYDEHDEARHIAEKAGELINTGSSPKEIAVLYRANFQSRVLEEAFMYSGIPYRLLGTKFFERKEVKDVLSFIRLALNGESSSDLKRIINIPARGIGKVSLLKILEGKQDELSPAMRAKVSDFYEMVNDISKQIFVLKPSELVKFVIQKTGINSMYKKTEEDQERIENIKELVTLSTKYDQLVPEDGIEKLIEEAALQTDQDGIKKEDDVVTLMTIHASKGLEFDYVFITGLEEGLFPHERIGSEEKDDEEERRLFYVALTRARQRVFLTYTNVRTIFGSKQVNIPSQFVNDIDPEMIETEAGDDDYNSQKVVYLD